MTVHDTPRMVSEALELIARLEVAIDHGLLQRVRRARVDRDDPAGRDLRRLAALAVVIYRAADEAVRISERYEQETAA